MIKNRLDGYIDALGLDLSKSNDVITTYDKMGLDAFHPLASGVTGVRAHMGNKARDTAMPLVKYEIPKFISGIEIPMAEYVSDIKMPETGIIKSKICISKNKYVLIYENKDEILSHIIVTNFVHNYEKFGYPLNFTETFLNARKGSVIKKGEILSSSNQVVNGVLCFGANLTCLGVTLDGVNEDAVIISDYAAEKLSYYTYDKLKFDINSDDLLLNINGDLENYKPIPDVGDYIEGIVLGKRTISSLNSIAMLTDEALLEFDEAFDKMLYHEGGEVVDINVIGSDLQTTSFPKIFEQLMGIIDRSKGLNNLIKSKFGNHKKRTVKSSKLIHDINNYNRGRKLKMRGNSIFIQIELVIKKKCKVGINSKVTGIDGNKGIVCGIYPRDMMPRLEDGTIIDYLDETASVPGRNNSPVLSLGGLNYAYTQLQKDMRGYFKLDIHSTDIDVNSLSMDEKKWGVDYFLGFLEVVESPLFEVINIEPFEEQVNVLGEILTDQFTILLGDNTRSILIVLEKLHASPYRIRRQNATIGLSGVTQNVDTPLSPTVRQIIVQNKLGNKSMAVSCPFVNAYDLPTSRKGKDKATRQNNYSAIKMAGEPDLRIYTSFVKPEAILDFIELGKSSDVRDFAYETILNADKPSNIERAIDRSIIPYGQDAFTKLYQSLTRSIGYMPVYKKFYYDEKEKFEKNFINTRWSCDVDLFNVKEKL